MRAVTVLVISKTCNNEMKHGKIERGEMGEAGAEVEKRLSEEKNPD